MLIYQFNFVSTWNYVSMRGFAERERCREDASCGWRGLFGETVQRAYTIGNCMSVGEQWAGVSRIRVRTIPVRHELTDAF
jgi:hypothetical protein